MRFDPPINANTGGRADPQGATPAADKIKRAASVKARLLKSGAIIVLPGDGSKCERDDEPRLPRIALSVDETAQVLGSSRAWVSQCIAKGQIGSVKIAGRRLVYVGWLIDALCGRAAQDEPPTFTRPIQPQPKKEISP